MIAKILRHTKMYTVGYIKIRDEKEDYVTRNKTKIKNNKIALEAPIPRKSNLRTRRLFVFKYTSLILN